MCALCFLSNRIETVLIVLCPAVSIFPWAFISIAAKNKWHTQQGVCSQEPGQGERKQPRTLWAIVATLEPTKELGLCTRAAPWRLESTALWSLEVVRTGAGTVSSHSLLYSSLPQAPHVQSHAEFLNWNSWGTSFCATGDPKWVLHYQEIPS
jgi:hypothetical protein